MVSFFHKSLYIAGAMALASLLAPRPALSASASTDATKVLAIKKLDAARRDGTTVALPAATFQRWNATVLDENVNYVVLEVSSANAEGLRDDLRAHAQAVEIREDFDVLKFIAFPIDSRTGQPSYPAAYTRTSPRPAPARDTFVIQFRAIPRPEWLGSIKQAGATVIDYIPENGYTVLVSSTAISDLATRLPVQLLRLHQPIHKIREAARNTTEAFIDIAVSILNVPEAAEAITFLNSIKLAEVRPADRAGDRSYFRVTVAASGLPQLAAFPAVVWIEPLPIGVPSGEREAHLIAGDTLVTNGGGVLQPTSPAGYRSWLNQKGFLPVLTGDPTYASMKVALLDTGFGDGSGFGHDDFYNSAPNSFVTVVNYTSNDPSGSNEDCYGHGTMVAGVIGGNAGGPFSSDIRDSGGSGYWMGTGVAPSIGLVAGRIFNFLTGSPLPTVSPQGWTTIYSDLANRGVAITNNSWNSNTSDYTVNDSEVLDKIVRSANGTDGGPPMAIFFSAGNRESVPPSEPYVTAPATAKNVVAVGASENYNPNPVCPVGSPNCYDDIIGGTAGVAADNGNQIWSGSRIGPTVSSLRIKPDVVAPGTGIESPRTLSSAFNTGACRFSNLGSTIDPGSVPHRRHLWSRGTSFASPGAAGAAALLHKWFQDRNGGIAPRPSLLKAMLATLAYDLPAPVAPPPGNEQGFGKVDLTNAFRTDGRYYWINEAFTLTPASPNLSVYELTVKDVNKPVKITLVWTDAAGTSSVSQALKNNLDLLVESTQYAFYCAGNNTNLSTRRSKVFSFLGPPYATWNTRDNVEQCTFLAYDFGSTFNVHVRGIQIPSDGINVWSFPPSTVQQQDFSLFIENVVGQ